MRCEFRLDTCIYDSLAYVACQSTGLARLNDPPPYTPIPHGSPASSHCNSSVAKEEIESMRGFVEKNGKQTGAQRDRKDATLSKTVADDEKNIEKFSPGNK